MWYFLNSDPLYAWSDEEHAFEIPAVRLKPHCSFSPRVDSVLVASINSPYGNRMIPDGVQKLMQLEGLNRDERYCQSVCRRSWSLVQLEPPVEIRFPSRHNGTLQVLRYFRTLSVFATTLVILKTFSVCWNPMSTYVHLRIQGKRKLLFIEKRRSLLDADPEVRG